jgi:hypothetical protein
LQLGISRGFHGNICSSKHLQVKTNRKINSPAFAASNFQLPSPARSLTLKIIMNSESPTIAAAHRFEARASALMTTAGALLIVSALAFAVAIFRLVATDDTRASLSAGVAFLILAALPFAIAQVYAVRAQLLRIQAALENTSPPA